MERLWLLLRDLRANGVRHISGDLILIAAILRRLRSTSLTTIKMIKSKPFLVEADSLLIKIKSQRFIVRGESNGVQVVMEPPIGSIELINNVKLQPEIIVTTPLLIICREITATR